MFHDGIDGFVLIPLPPPVANLLYAYVFPYRFIRTWIFWGNFYTFFWKI